MLFCIASFVGRPVDNISGRCFVTASMKTIHCAGLFSVPSASINSAFAFFADSGISKVTVFCIFIFLILVYWCKYYTLYTNM